MPVQAKEEKSCPKAPGTHLGTVLSGENPRALSVAAPTRWLAHCSETTFDLIYAN